MSGFSEKVAVVTGAATGVGESIARRLFAGGARLVVVGHDKSGLESLLKDIDPGGARSRAVEGDVRDVACMAKAVSVAEEAFGGLQITVNNAGTPGPADILFEDLSLDDLGYRDRHESDGHVLEPEG